MDIEFPTKKPHVSYSEVKNWKECPYRHKLRYIDGIDLGVPSPYLDFGTNLHEGCEAFLKTGEIPVEQLIQNIREAWAANGFEDPDWIAKQPGWYKHEPVDVWCTWAKNMWAEVPSFLDETFPGWEIVEAEEMLYEEVESKPVKFKGFIDAIIKVPRKNGTYKYWILDWKTAKAYGWDRRKKQDFLVQAQIVLYKYYWAKKHGIPLKDIGCGFVLLKRAGKVGKICEFLPISAGPKMLEKSTKLVKSMIAGVQKRFFVKNRGSCMFCEYYQTEHCL